jgi:hypothetical protein
MTRRNHAAFSGIEYTTASMSMGNLTAVILGASGPVISPWRGTWWAKNSGDSFRFDIWDSLTEDSEGSFGTYPGHGVKRLAS